MILNELGIDPKRYSDNELFKEITEYTDLMLGLECLHELMERDENRAKEAMLLVLSLPQEDINYGDQFYQGAMLENLYTISKEDAQVYISENYDNVELKVFGSVIHLFNSDDERIFSKEFREKIKSYIEAKGKAEFKQIDEWLPGELDKFLKSI